MDPVNKFIIRDLLKNKFKDLTDDFLYELISELDQLKVLIPYRPKEEVKDIKPKEDISKLPKSFTMYSPMWNGEVKYTEKGDLIGYMDENNNLRLWAYTEKDLIKKVKKYKKN